jgi:hypothetical protein
VSERHITLTMTLSEAEAFSFALSDITCWASGFHAGVQCSHGLVDGPLGVERARDLNIKIKSAITKVYE